MITPVVPNRVFWSRDLNVALDGLAELVGPRQVVICEVEPSEATRGTGAEHDTKCYNLMFAAEFPDTIFVSGGNSHDVQRDRLALLSVTKSTITGTEVIQLIDRDERSDDEIR